MAYFSKRALRWAAPVVLVGALGLAACGDGDDVAVRTRAPAAPSAADQSAYQAGSRPNASAAYLAAQRAAADGYVEQLEARAASAANAYGDEQREPMSPNEATTLSPVDPVEAEREAHLEGQARTYGADH